VRVHWQALIRRPHRNERGSAVELLDVEDPSGAMSVVWGAPGLFVGGSGDLDQD